MPYNPEHPSPPIHPPEGIDYTQAGAYFVTICAYQRECLFGRLENGLVVSSQNEAIAERCWKVLPRDFPRIELDVFESCRIICTVLLSITARHTRR